MRNLTSAEMHAVSGGGLVINGGLSNVSSAGGTISIGINGRGDHGGRGLGVSNIGSEQKRPG